MSETRTANLLLSVVENAEGTWDVLINGELTNPRLTQWTEAGASEIVRQIHAAWVKAELAAEARGAERMRERCVAETNKWTDSPSCTIHTSDPCCHVRTGYSIATALAALPLEEGK